MQHFQQQDFKLPAAAATFKALLTCICILHSQLVTSVQLKYSSGIRSILNYTTVNVPFCFILYLIYWDFGESFGLAENKTLKLAIKFNLITVFIFNVISCSALCFLYVFYMFSRQKKHLHIAEGIQNPTLCNVSYSHIKLTITQITHQA